jgi:iron-sulfur cluster repair protein YtfE (RIC family)
MGNGTDQAPVSVKCEPEWAARPLTDLIQYLSHNYSNPIAQRLESISATADRTRLAAADVLRLVLEAHAWSEGDVMFPAATAIETYGRRSAPFKRDTLNILLEGIAQEHDLLRELLAILAKTMEECVAAGLNSTLESFVNELEIVCFLIAEQLDLEDRCLWPRMKDLFDR